MRFSLQERLNTSVPKKYGWHGMKKCILLLYLHFSHSDDEHLLAHVALLADVVA